MKKAYASVLLLLGGIAIASCGDPAAPASSDHEEASISISQKGLSLEVGQTQTLTAELKGSSAALTWTSSDPTIATVSEGKVTALKAGTCTIQVQAGDLFAQCSLTVTPLSMAPRIVLSDVQVSIDKGASYGIDAYVLYQDEILDVTLEADLKEGDSNQIATIAYSNKKLNVQGLAYGQATYIVHAKALGITLSQTLKVKVCNTTLSLSISNLESLGEDVYKTTLATEKVEGQFEKEITPTVAFTEKGQPATYALTYSSSDDQIAAWENGKIVAKKNGQATLKITCEEFAMEVEIRVTVYKGAYNMVLKNASADGSSLTERIGAGKMPASPTMEGKTFLGWYDEEGNPVNEILDDGTLIARYASPYYGENNTIALRLDTQPESAFEAVEGYTKLQLRSDADRAADVASKSYPGTEGSMCFFPWDGPDWYNGPSGITLPAFDFSSSGDIFFRFGAHSATDYPVKLAGNDIGKSTSNPENFLVTIQGKNVTVHNANDGQDYTFSLNDEVYKGQKGLSIACENFVYRFVYVSPFYELNYDYVGACLNIEATLPDTPVNQDSDIAMVQRYQALRKLYSQTEDTLYPQPEKMTKWISALPHTVLSFANHGGECQMNGLSQGASAAYKANTLGTNTAFDLGEGYCIALTNDQTAGKYGSITLPAFDFSSYTSVVFTFGQGGNGGGTSCRYYLGSVDSSTSYDDSLNLPNYLGEATSTDTNAWNLATDIKATVSQGKISFKGSASSINKTLDLDEKIYKGNEGLTLTLANVCWEFFVLSPFTGSNI